MNTFIYKLFNLSLLLVFLTGCAQNYTRTQRGMKIAEDSVDVYISCVTENTIHIQAYPKGTEAPSKSWVADDSGFPVPGYKIQTAGNVITLQTSRLSVNYDLTSRNISFSDALTGEIILAEESATRTLRPVTILGEEMLEINQGFSLSSDEGIYGLGQYQEGILNYRGKTANLVQANMEIVNPFLISTRNYGLLWNNYSKTTFTDNEQGATFWSEAAAGIDYYFIYGKNMEDAIAGYRTLTGEVPMQPKSAFGFWQSKERYKSFDELTEVVKEYRRRRIPLDNIVQDWEYWGDKAHWNSMEFHPDNFANPEKAIAALHDTYNVKLTLSVWPGFGKETKIYHSLDSAGALFDEPTWAGYKVVDIYNPVAREIFWDYLYRGLYIKGVDAWWLDATEPSFREGFTQDKQEARTKSAGMTHIGPFHRYLNTYSLVLTHMMYNKLREQSDKRVSILTRSAFAGQQKYGTSVWSGDIYASWDVMARQIPAGLNFSLSGIPYWTSDIGAFYVTRSDEKGNGGYTRGLADPAYLELYTRWFQFGAFSPIFRAHGTNVPREIWQFGKPGTPFYDAQLKMINLRYSLLSYIYSEAWKVTSAGSTLMRALVMDFPEDTATHDNKEGYMFGKSLLVYPVLRPMYYDRSGKIKDNNTNVSIYLPRHKSNIWYDLNSADCYQGGSTISYNAPLDVIPLLVKGGSIVPRNQIVQHVNQDDGSVMDIVVYTGADADFVLYEDDNETYAYEKGEYCETQFTWNEEGRVLTITGLRNNTTLGLTERIFNIRLIEPAEDGTYKEKVKEVVFSCTDSTTVFMSKIDKSKRNGN